MKVDLIEERETLVAKSLALAPVRSSPLATLRREIRAASNGLLSIFDQAIVSATSFVTAAIIGRMTSPDELGLYYLTLTIVLIIVGVQDQIIAAPYLLYAKRYQGGAHAEYSGSVWLHHWLLTAAVVVGLAITIGVCSLTGRTTILPGMWALLFAAPLLLLREDLRRFMFADLHLRSVVAIDTTIAVVQLGGLLLLGYLGQLTLFAIFGVMGGACALAALGWLVFDPPQARLSRERVRSDWDHNWAFAKWALRGHLLVSTTPYLMIWLVNWTHGPVAAGVLGACTTLVGITRVIQGGVTNVLTTQSALAFANGHWNALGRLLVRNTVFLTLTVGGACLLFLFTGDALLVLVYGEFYRGSGLVLLALATSALLGSYSMVAGNGLWAVNRAPSNFAADVVCSIGMLVVAALLVAPMGALGAALATLAGTAVATVVRVVILVKAWGSDNSSTKQAAGVS